MQWTSIALSVGMAIAAGLVCCFAVMRRMALASDAMSVALPGIGLALAFHIHPVLGAIAALVVGTLLVWALERRTRIPTETVIGVVFSLALAVGSMRATGEELIDALLGAPGTPGPWELALGLVGAAAVVAFVLAYRDKLVLALVSAEIAKTSGIRVARLELAYLLAFSLTVALGLRYLGVLLMGSLIIIPAAAAKYLARSLRGMLTIAASRSRPRFRTDRGCANSRCDGTGDHRHRRQRLLRELGVAPASVGRVRPFARQGTRSSGALAVRQRYQEARDRFASSASFALASTTVAGSMAARVADPGALLDELATFAERSRAGAGLGAGGVARSSPCPVLVVHEHRAFAQEKLASEVAQCGYRVERIFPTPS